MTETQIATTQQALPLELAVGPDVAWVGLCPQCQQVVAATLILPKEKRGDTYKEDHFRTLGEWTVRGLVVRTVDYRPMLDGCKAGCTWLAEH
jgi:hypothetical protein